MTVPKEVIEYEKLARAQQQNSSDRHALPVLSPEKRRLLESLPATDVLFKPILKKVSQKEGTNRSYTFAKEIEFYEQKLQMVPELRPFVPVYYGTRFIVDTTTDGNDKSSMLFQLGTLFLFRELLHKLLLMPSVRL